MRELFLVALMIGLTWHFLTGCVPAAIVGAGAGGYYVGTDERPAKTIAKDAAITTEINTRYVGDRNVSAWDINVDTYDGVVTLYGNVPNADAEARAVDIASRVKGVNRVVSKLTVVH